MLAIEGRIDGPRGRPRAALQLFRDGTKEFIRAAGLHQHSRYLTCLRKLARFGLVIVRGVEDDRHARTARIGAQQPDELVSVHGGHQNVGNDQVRPCGLYSRQSVGTVRRLDHAVTFVAEQ